MAGLFDFKSAEDILKERQDTTRKNVMQAFNQPGQYEVRGERTANAVGKILGLLGGQLFADSPEEQVAGQMQRANQLAQSLKPVEGESQSQFYNRIAVSFNDAGYSQNALRALTLAKEAEAVDAKEAQRLKERGEERGEMTAFQQAQIKNQENRTKLERDLYGLGGGGTGAGGGTSAGDGTPANKTSYKPGDIITGQDGKQVVVGEDGSLIPKETYDAQQKAKELGFTREPGPLEKGYDLVSKPWRLLGGVVNRAEVFGQAQMVKKALETGRYTDRYLDAMRDLVKLPQEESGLTPSEYDNATTLVLANPE
jgi:hypothetical protein